MDTPRRQRPARGLAPWAMLVGTLAWSWVWLGLAALTGRPWLVFPTVLLTLTGLLGVIVVPALLLWCGYGEESARSFFRRCFDPRTLAWRWYAGLAGLLLVFGLLPAVIARGTSGLVPTVSGPAIFLLFGLVAGALEEPAWRGYAQEGLQRRLPVAAASLVIGAVWSAWHLPLFLLEGTYQYEIGIGAAGFWAFLAGPVVLAVVYGWLYNAAGRVAFAAVAFHGLGNLMRELWDAEAPVVSLGVEAALAVVLVVAGWRWLRRPAPRAGSRVRTGTTAEPD